MGVEWTADLANSSRDQVFLVGLILQVASFCALIWNVSIVLPYWRVNRSWFWHASLFASIVMLAMPAFEIAFILARFTSHTLISFPTIATAVGDMLGRSAYSGITILRFFRLRIVAPVKRRTSARYFYLASAVIAAANIAAIASSFDLRSAESSLPPVKAGQTVSRATPEIKRLREQDRLISFGAFMITTVASVATDLLFYHAIVTSRTSVQSNVSSVPKTVKWQIFRPYIPALLASILYFICLQLSFFDPMIPSIVFATITLGKLVPAIDTIIFFRFSIEQTKTLLKSLSSSNSRPRAASGGEGRGNAPAGNVFPLFPVQQPSASARSNHATVGPVYATPEDIKDAEALSWDPNPLKPHAVGHGWYGADHSPPHRPTRQVDLNINTDMRQPPLSPTYSTAPTTPAVTPRTTSFLLSPLSPRSDQNGTGQDRQYRLNKQ